MSESERPASDHANFPMASAWALVRDLMAHNPRVYFSDFICSAAIGYGAVWIYFTAPNWSLLQAAALLTASFGLFRAGVFIHEIVHMPGGKMTAFKVFWNIFYGIPMLTPSFMYANHTDHHARRYYGTTQDGEYQPFAHGSPWRIVAYFAQVPLLPVFGIARFLVLSPLAWVFPSIRSWVWRAASSYISNPTYKRQVPADENHRWWIVAEIACFFWIAALVVLFASGVIPTDTLLKIYALSCVAILWNWIRNLAGHLFLSDGRPMSHVAQFRESVTITGSPWPHELLFPVGLRYHAIHHLFPAMPYHNMGEAHRRLLRDLPASAGYRDTLYKSILDVFAALSRNMHAAGALPPIGRSVILRAYIACTVVLLFASWSAAIFLPKNIAVLAVDNGPLDQISSALSLVSVIVACGVLILSRAKSMRAPVVVAMLLGLVGFLNAVWSKAGPLPFEFSELVGAIVEPSNLAEDTWSGLLMTGLLFVFLLFTLLRYWRPDSSAGANRILLTALIIAFLSPAVGDAISGPAAPARLVVEVLEACSSAGFLLAAVVSICAAMPIASSNSAPALPRRRKLKDH